MLHFTRRRRQQPAGSGMPNRPTLLSAAARPRGRNQSRTAARRSRAPAAGATVRFHGPSFSGGIVLGALLVLTVAYLPELTSLLPDRPAAKTTGTAAPDTPVPDQPELRFEFEELLSSTEVAPATGRYAEAEETLSELYLQAASFRTQEEADRLRADLLLLDLPTTTSPVELADGRWIRVTVGPFQSPVQANRAMTALRNRNIAPIWIKRKATG